MPQLERIVIVTPHQDWGEVGKADVWRIEGTDPKFLARLDLIYKANPQDITVERAQHPEGLLIINTDKLPTGSHELVGLIETDAQNEIIPPPHLEHGWPNGHGGVLFKQE
jgi:hypothetical protein